MESDSVASLSALLDALVLPENVVYDSVKHSMNLPSNLPDIDARKDELRKLLFRLRPSEIRFLKDELSGITFVTDGIPKLPENVLAKIALDVDIVDVIRFRGVSKAWKRAWDASSVYKDVMRKYMYGYYESSYKNLPNNSLALRIYFEERAKRIHSIRHGLFQSLFTLPFGTGDRVGDGTSFPRYHSGKIARMVNSRSTVLVMNLHKGSDKRYNTPQRVGLLDFELSSMYLIGRSAQNMLYAWSLNDDSIMEVRLPVRANSIYVHKDRVGVLLGNQEILIWTIGGKLRHLKYALPGVEQGFHSFKHNAILFNPFDRAEITVISTYFEQLSPNHYCPKVMARSYSSTSPAGRDWSETSTLSRLIFLHKDESNLFVWNHTPPPFNLVVRPITDTGDFNLCPLLPQITYLEEGGDVIQIRYNVCERRLSDVIYLCPPFDCGNPREQAVWNGMLYIHRLDRSDQWPQSGNETIMGIKPLNEKVGNTNTPFTSTDALWVGDIDEETEKMPRTQFKWTRCYADMIYLDDSNSPSLFADNDFVVFFSKEEALIACYDEKDDLTSSGGVRVTSNSK